MSASNVLEVACANTQQCGRRFAVSELAGETACPDCGAPLSSATFVKTVLCSGCNLSLEICECPKE